MESPRKRVCLTSLFSTFGPIISFSASEPNRPAFLMGGFQTFAKNTRLPDAQLRICQKTGELFAERAR